jgi:hypothetical protein
MQGGLGGRAYTACRTTLEDGRYVRPRRDTRMIRLPHLLDLRGSALEIWMVIQNRLHCFCTVPHACAQGSGTIKRGGGRKGGDAARCTVTEGVDHVVHHLDWLVAEEYGRLRLHHAQPRGKTVVSKRQWNPRLRKESGIRESYRMGDRIGDEDDLLAGTEEAVVMGDEAELLEGTEEAVVMGDEEELLEATEEAAAEAAAEAAELAAMQQRRAQASGEGVEETSVEETMETLEDVMSPVLREGADGRFVGKRKIKEYTWSPVSAM